MIADDEVMRLFEQADPARTTDEYNHTPDATGYLAALRTRSYDMTIIDPTDTSTKPPDKRRWMVMAASAAAVILAVVGGLALLTRDVDDDPEIPASVPPTLAPTPTPTPTPTPAPPAEDALGRAGEFLAAFASGDPDEVAALQTDGFELRSAWPGEGLEPIESHEWLGANYLAASATAFVDPECVVTGEEAAVATVECTTAMSLAVHQATNTDGVPTTVTIGVRSEGVDAMNLAFMQNFGATILAPFDAWQDVNRPETVGADGDDPVMVEGIVEYAQTEAQLATEWASFAVDSVEATFADFNAGDLESLLARFTSGVAWAPDEFVSALIADGTQYLASACTPDGITLATLAVSCDITVRRGSFDTTGVELTGTFRMRVSADGRISPNSGNTVDWGPSNEFNAAFRQWLADVHPDVDAEVTWIDVDGNVVASADDQPTVARYYGEFVAQSDVYPLGG